MAHLWSGVRSWSANCSLLAAPLGSREGYNREKYQSLTSDTTPMQPSSVRLDRIWTGAAECGLHVKPEACVIPFAGQPRKRSYHALPSQWVKPDA